MAWHSRSDRLSTWRWEPIPPDYIKLYNDNVVMLTTSLDATQNASAVLLPTPLPSFRCFDSES